MNLAFLTNEYPHPKIGSSGGIGTSIRNLAESYIKLGHKVFIFVVYKDFEQFIEGGIEHISILPKTRVTGLIGLYIKNKIIQNKINKIIVSEGINFIEIPDWVGIGAFMSFKCKSVIKFNGADTYFCHLEQRKLKTKNYFLEYINIKRADIYIFVSSFTAEVSQKLFKLYSKKLHVLPNAINIQNFKPVDSIPSNINKEATILYLGTLIRKKGCLEIPHILNEVLKLNNNVKLILIGNDSKDISTGSNSTWALMKPLFNDSTKVDYNGAMPYEQVKNSIAEADVCIYPSFAEALPMTWLEAMAMQKAIVASDIGWAKEIVDDGINGFLVNPKNHEDYAKKIVQLISDPTLRIEMGKKARVKIEKDFDILKIAQKHIDLYNSIK